MKLLPLIMSKMSCVLLFAVAVGFLFQTANAQSNPAENFKVTTVYLIRHAERGTEPATDPALSEPGKTRSQTLARMLEKSGVKGIYTSQFARSIQTGEPLAQRLGISVTPQTMALSPSNPVEVTQESLKQITDKIAQHQGEGVLVIGHTNTIPQVIKLLGGDVVPTIAEQSYDDLFIVTIYQPGKAKVAHLKY